MSTVLAISAGLSTPSSSRLLAERLGTALRAAASTPVEVEHVELRDYAHDITDHVLTGFANQHLAELLDRLAEADGLILVTPTFSASYSGLFKSFTDVLDPEWVRDKPVLIGATGGTERHSLVLEYALRPLLAYLRATVAPTGVYAASGDWGSDSELGARIERAAGELAELLTNRPQPRQADPFADAVPFTQLLEQS